MKRKARWAMNILWAGVLGTGFLLLGCPSGGGGQVKDGNGGASSKMQAVSAEPAPDFSLKGLKGRTYSLGQFKNKVVLLNFWATWCEPCKKEFPHFQRFLDTYKDKGFEVVAISVDEAKNQADVGPTVYRYGYKFVVLLDPEGRVDSLYNPKRNHPYSVLIDRRGQIRMRHQGYNPGDEKEMERYIQELVQEGAQ